MRRLGDAPGLEAAGAHAEVADASVHRRPHRTEVRQGTSLGLVVRVGDVVADERPLPTDVAATCHWRFSLEKRAGYYAGREKGQATLAWVSFRGAFPRRGRPAMRPGSAPR